MKPNVAHSLTEMLGSCLNQSTKLKLHTLRTFVLCIDSTYSYMYNLTEAGYYKKINITISVSAEMRNSTSLLSKISCTKQKFSQLPICP